MGAPQSLSQCSSYAPCSSEVLFEPNQCDMCHPQLTSLLKPSSVLSRANLSWSLIQGHWLAAANSAHHCRDLFSWKGPRLVERLLMSQAWTSSFSSNWKKQLTSKSGKKSKVKSVCYVDKPSSSTCLSQHRFQTPLPPPSQDVSHSR